MIDDTRLNEALAILDDARALLVDLVDERPLTADVRDYNNLDAARQFLNSAVPYIQAVMPAPRGVS